MSCKQGVESQFIASQFNNLTANLERQFPDAQFDCLLTCSSGLSAANGNRILNYSFRSHEGRRTGQVPICDLAELVRQFASPYSKLILIGHSHGGWHAMQAVANLECADGLFTLEPISPNQCDTRAYLQNQSRLVLKKRESIVPACRQAPTDLDLLLIQSTVRGNWHNHFLVPAQDRGDLHSSEATAAKNHAWCISGGSRAHHRLGLDDRIWSHICREVSILLSECDSNCCLDIRVDDKGRVQSAEASL